MFSTLGLLSGGRCPDKDQCTRVRCFFSHDNQPLPSRKPGKATSVSVPQKRPTERDPLFLYDSPGQSPVKRPMTSSTAITPPTPPVVPRVKPVVPSARKVGEAVKPAAKPQPIPTSKPPPTAVKTPSVAPVAGPSDLVPILSKSAKTSPHPWADRQKGLRTLHGQFEKLVLVIYLRSESCVNL